MTVLTSASLRISVKCCIQGALKTKTHSLLSINNQYDKTGWWYRHYFQNWVSKKHSVGKQSSRLLFSVTCGRQLFCRIYDYDSCTRITGLSSPTYRPWKTPSKWNYCASETQRIRFSSWKYKKGQIVTVTKCVVKFQAREFYQGRRCTWYRLYNNCSVKSMTWRLA